MRCEEVKKGRRKDEKKRRKRGKNRGTNRKKKTKKEVRAHLFHLRSRHFLDQSENTLLIKKESKLYLLSFSCKILSMSKLLLDWIETEPFMDRMIGNKNEPDIEICGVKCKALIDTGSSMTTMSRSFYECLCDKPELLSFDTFKLDVRAAGGTQVLYSGYIKADIKVPFLNERPIWFPVLIVQDKQYPGQVPVIIGTNATGRFKALSCDISVPSAWDIAFES